MPELVLLFTLGAAASLIGDHSHVATGTTEYLTDAVPFVWSSPIWFRSLSLSRPCHWPTCVAACGPLGRR
jgi:hypothetical protein